MFQIFQFLAVVIRIHIFFGSIMPCEIRQYNLLTYCFGGHHFMVWSIISWHERCLVTSCKMVIIPRVLWHGFLVYIKSMASLWSKGLWCVMRACFVSSWNAAVRWFPWMQKIMVFQCKDYSDDKPMF